MHDSKRKSNDISHNNIKIILCIIVCFFSISSCHRTSKPEEKELVKENLKERKWQTFNFGFEDFEIKLDCPGQFTETDYQTDEYYMENSRILFNSPSDSLHIQVSNVLYYDEYEYMISIRNLSEKSIMACQDSPKFENLSYKTKYFLLDKIPVCRLTGSYDVNSFHYNFYEFFIQYQTQTAQLIIVYLSESKNETLAAKRIINSIEINGKMLNKLIKNQ